MCRRVKDLWRIVSKKYVVEVGGVRYEQQPQDIYAIVLMQRLKPALVSLWTLACPPLLPVPVKSSNLSGSLIDAASQIPLKPSYFSAFTA